LALALAGCAAGAPKIYLSRAPKGAVASYLSRFARAGEPRVVTKKAPAAATETIAIQANDGEDLYLVEPGPGGLPADLPGEKGRLAGVAVIGITAGVEPEQLIADHRLYFEAIPGAERDAGGEPAVATHAAPRDARAFAGINLDRAFLEARLNELSGAAPVTIDGRSVTISERKSAANRANARAFLRAQYEALGFTVAEVPYGNSGGVNFVAERAGADAGTFLAVTSHLDSVGNAGADDNGAGTIAALGIARALQGKTLRTGLRIVAFDQEELGLLGSSAYAKQLDDQHRLAELTGVVNLEMLGYDGNHDGAFHAIDCDENTSSTLTAAVEAAVAADPALRLHKTEACTNRSDHAAFWRYDRPAIVVSQDFFGGDDDPCYHSACDKVDNVDFDYMTRLGTLMARATAALTGAG
jgi:hypothetical protein